MVHGATAHLGNCLYGVCKKVVAAITGLNLCPLATAQKNKMGHQDKGENKAKVQFCTGAILQHFLLRDD